MTKNKLNNKSNLIVSIDDYNEKNVQLALQIKKIGLQAIFYIDTGQPVAEIQIKAINALGHEIGCHTVHHPPDMKLLSPEAQLAEIEVAKKTIEENIGKPCKSFAYPRGRYNEHTIEALKKAGFETARTTIVLETENNDPYRMHTTVHAYDGRKEYKGRKWRELADFYLDHVMKNGGDMHVWGHTKELIENNQYVEFLDFLKHAVKLAKESA